MDIDRDGRPEIFLRPPKFDLKDIEDGRAGYWPGLPPDSPFESRDYLPPSAAGTMLPLVGAKSTTRGVRTM